MRRPQLHRLLESVIVFMLLLQLCLKLFHHLLFYHAPESVAHRVSSCFESSQASRRLRGVFLKLPLELRLEEDLDEATLGRPDRSNKGGVDLLELGEVDLGHLLLI